MNIKKNPQHSLNRSNVGSCDDQTLLVPWWVVDKRELLCLSSTELYTKAEWTSFLALNSHTDCWEEDRNTNDATDTRLMLHCVEPWCVTTGWCGAGKPRPLWIQVLIERRFSSVCTHLSQNQSYTQLVSVTQLFIFPFSRSSTHSVERKLWLLLSSSYYSLSSSISTPGVR